MLEIEEVLRWWMPRCVVQLFPMVMFLVVRSMMVDRCQWVLRGVVKLFLKMVRLNVVRIIMVNFMVRFMMVRFMMVRLFVVRVIMVRFYMVMFIMEQRFHFVQGKVFIMNCMRLHKVFRQMEGP